VREACVYAVVFAALDKPLLTAVRACALARNLLQRNAGGRMGE
jgi:hypothetical protein